MRMLSEQSRRSTAVSLDEVLYPGTSRPAAAARVSHSGLYWEPGSPQERPSRTATHSRPLRGLGKRIAMWRERRAAVGALSGMSDRELADIGLSRSQIYDVFGPGFAREHARPGHSQEPALAPNTLALTTTKQETTMKTIFAVFFVALVALAGATATAHAYDAAPDRATVSGNAAG
jgi:uncharacterized protein YjiS (DUF1127 family)